MGAGGGRATAIVDVLVPCVLALSLVTACSTGATAEPSGGPRQTSGISREEYCAMGGHVVTRITAEQERTAVVVRWSEFTSSLDERVFRVYRRSGPAAQWSRVAEVELAPGHGGSWRDPSPPRGNTSSTGTTQYAVTQVSSTCGEGRLCAGTPPAQQCSLATVTRREQ